MYFPGPINTYYHITTTPIYLSSLASYKEESISKQKNKNKKKFSLTNQKRIKKKFWYKKLKKINKKIIKNKKK
jgi:hypothetical protein